MEKKVGRPKKRTKKTNDNLEVKLPEDAKEKALQEESLFINETQLNEKMANDFFKFYKRKIRRSDFYTILLCGVILIIIAINYLLEGNDYLFGIVCNIVINTLLILAGIYLWIYAFKYQKYDKKESKKIYNEDISTYMNYYYFNDERVIIKNKIGTTDRQYDCLEAIYESKECYYILITKRSGYVMKKDSFKKGEEEQFHKFIKEKMGKNYKKRCHRKRVKIKKDSKDDINKESETKKTKKQISSKNKKKVKNKK